MAVLTAERSISRKGAESTACPPTVTRELKAGAKVFKGALVATDATGYAVSGASIQATGLKIWGIATKTVDNTAGANGALSVDVLLGVFPFQNGGAAADPVAQADVGAAVFADDDQSIRKTSGTSTRSNVGTFIGFDESSQALVRVGNCSQTAV
jgi:hypothetical protein